MDYLNFSLILHSQFFTFGLSSWNFVHILLYLSDPGIVINASTYGSNHYFSPISVPF
jgi:hypothetical protein